MMQQTSICTSLGVALALLVLGTPGLVWADSPDNPETTDTAVDLPVDRAERIVERNGGEDDHQTEQTDGEPAATDDVDKLDADGALAERAAETAGGSDDDTSEPRGAATGHDEEFDPETVDAAPDEAPSAIEIAVDNARHQADRGSGGQRAGAAVERAHDAALIRTDIELDAEFGADESLLDDKTVRDSLDGERVARLRAFFERFSAETDEETPTPLVRLREVGNRIAQSTSSHLPLQPYIPDPSWQEAMALLADDECDEALETATDVLGPPEVHIDGEPAVAYAFARMKECSDDADGDGRAILRELADDPSPISRLARRELGRSTQTIDDGALDVSGYIRRAKQRADRGEVDAALADLRDFRQDLSRGWHRHQVRFAEAEILEEADRLDEAAMAYRAIYRKTSGWQSSDGIASRIERAEDRLDRTIITFGDRVDRMRALISRSRFRQARAVSRENAQLRGVGGAEIRGWTRYRQALQNERQRNRKRAAEQFEEAADLVADPAIRPRLYFGWARALRRTDGDTEAIELYDRICEEFRDHRLCEQSMYESGRLHQYRNRHDEARKRFSRLVSYHPFSEHVPDALWRYALSAHLQGDYENAISPLETIVAHHGEIQDASELTIGLKARYWIGVNHLKNGDKERAHRWLQETIDEGPMTWYGRLAVSRLEDAGISPRVPAPTASLTREDVEEFATLRVPDNPRLETAAQLTRLGLYEEALAEVRSQLNVHPAPEGATRLRAALHLAVDEPNWAHWIMKSVIDESGPTHRSLRDWGFAFPLDYFELSHQYGDKFGVSPHLVHAIMRQESGFRPTVSSPAGAMGLMQVMPGTARYTARTFFEEQNLSRAQILDEETNVRLGTMYIRIHEAHASDQTPLALAGYNAGPAPLQSWFERYDDRELDAWVESITYRETRGYVRKVMTSYITYKGLYGEGDMPRIDLELPDELRDWGEVPEVDEDEPVSMVVN